MCVQSLVENISEKNIIPTVRLDIDMVRRRSKSSDLDSVDSCSSQTERLWPLLHRWSRRRRRGSNKSHHVKCHRSECQQPGCFRSLKYPSNDDSRQVCWACGRTKVGYCTGSQHELLLVDLGPKDFCHSFQCDIQQLNVTERLIDHRFTLLFTRLSKGSLTHLTLSGCKLHLYPRNARRLLDNLPTSSLRHLDLSWNGLTEEMITRFATKTLSVMSLENVQLSGNPICDRGIKVLVEEGQLHRIRHVDLTDCDVGDTGTQFLQMAMKQSNVNIEKLVLNMNGIGNVGAEFLSDGIKTCRSLKSLNLRCNNLDHVGVQTLSEALRHSNLEDLNLGANHLGTRGVQVLASALNYTKLRKLCLCYNGITDEGIVSLAVALEMNTSLVELRLSSNRITSESIPPIVCILEQNSTLKSLHLNGNQIDRRGALEVGVTLRDSNHTVRDLTLLERNYENHLVNNKLDIYLDANSAGRRYWGDYSVPTSGWCRKMSTMNTNSLYWFLRGRPDIVARSSVPNSDSVV